MKLVKSVTAAIEESKGGSKQVKGEKEKVVEKVRVPSLCWLELALGC
jgi:hypothetical protein